MATELSRYRRQAREVIERAIATLPADATEVDARRALRDVSWGRGHRSGDGMSWPLQCWYREVKAALGKRFGRKKDRATAYDCCYEFLIPNEANHRRRFWLVVRCGWCNKTWDTWEEGRGTHSGCFMCGPRIARLRELLEHGPCWAFLQSCRTDASLCPIFADWLEEHDADELAALFRGVTA